jgi:hypothetical protein
VSQLLFHDKDPFSRDKEPSISNNCHKENETNILLLNILSFSQSTYPSLLLAFSSITTMLLKSAASGLLALSTRGVVQKIGPQALKAASTQQASWGAGLASPSALKRRAYSSTTAVRAGEMDSMETGTKKYMSLYPEGSTDGSK